MDRVSEFLKRVDTRFAGCIKTLNRPQGTCHPFFNMLILDKSVRDLFILALLFCAFPMICRVTAQDNGAVTAYPLSHSTGPEIVAYPQRLPNIANVRKFGAQGDGMVDDTEAIRAAINAGQLIVFPPGNYMVTGDLVIGRSNVTLLGFGMGVSTIRIKTLWTKSSSAPVTVAALINIMGTASAPISNIGIRGLHLVGIKRPDVADEPKAISGAFNDNVIIDGNYIEGFGHEAIWPAGSGVRPVTHWRITNNHFFDIGINSVPTAPSAVSVNGRNFIVSHNTFDNVLGAIGLADARAVVSNNLIYNVAFFGIGVGGDGVCDDVTVSGNEISFSASAGPVLRAGIRINGDARNVSIVGNTIRVTSVPGASTACGIYATGARNGVLVSSNTIALDGATAGGSLGGIIIMGDKTDITVSNNLINLDNENKNYISGIQVQPSIPDETVKAVLIGNVVRGFSRKNTAYAFDVNKNSRGTLDYLSLGNVTDGGYVRFEGLKTGDSLKDVPVFQSRPGRIYWGDSEPKFPNELSAKTLITRNLHGSLVLAGNTRKGSVAFDTMQPDTDYSLAVTPVSGTGRPLRGSNRVLSIHKTTTDFTVILETAPGTGNSVTFDWQLIR